MIQKLSKHGDNLALVIDPSILDQLKINENTPLDISMKGDALVIAPVRDTARREKFEQALASTNERYAKALKRLAE